MKCGSNRGRKSSRELNSPSLPCAEASVQGSQDPGRRGHMLVVRATAWSHPDPSPPHGGASLPSWLSPGLAHSATQTPGTSSSTRPGPLLRSRTPGLSSPTWGAVISQSLPAAPPKSRPRASSSSQHGGPWGEVLSAGVCVGPIRPPPRQGPACGSVMAAVPSGAHQPLAVSCWAVCRALQNTLTSEHLPGTHWMGQSCESLVGEGATTPCHPRELPASP